MRTKKKKIIIGRVRGALSGGKGDEGKHLSR
jgi:hypothetical protein